MKKNVFTLLAGAALLCACQATDNKGRIDLELAEMKSDTLWVGSYVIQNRENLKIDTILPGQTTYTFVAETDSNVYKIFIAPTDGTNKAIVLALLPGEHIKVTGSMEDWQVAGSELNATYAPIQQACYPYVEKMDSLEKIMTDEIYRNEYLPTWRQMDSLQADYVRQHPDDDLSLFILENIRGESIDELYPTLTERVKNGPLAPIAQVFEDGIRQKKLFEENKKKIVEGAEAPDFTLNDLNGQPLSLSSLRGKYVVLDFWGSWCGWCIKGIPDMKKIQGQAGNPGHRLPRHGREVEGRCRETRTAVAARTQRRRTRCQCPLCHTGLSHQDCHRPRRQDCQDCRGRRPGFLSISGRTV